MLNVTLHCTVKSLIIICSDSWRFTSFYSTHLQVSSLFKDGTIGTDINIVVVSLLLLEQDPVSGFRKMRCFALDTGD